MRAPGGSRDDHGADRLMEHREPDVHAAHHRGDAKQYLGAECGMDRPGGPRIDTLHLAGENDKRGDDHPGPPAMEEVEQEGIIGQRVERAPAPINAFGNKLTLHQRPVAGDIAGVESGDPGAEQ